MKNSTTSLFLASAVLAFTVTGKAAAGDTYQIEVSRSQGEVICNSNSADGGTQDCQTSVKAQSNLSITMTASSTGKGYVGVDKVVESGSNYTLFVIADDNKQIKDVMLMHTVSSDQQSFDGSLALSSASSVMAVNISPMHIQKVDAQSAKVQLGFVAYAPSSAAKSLQTDNQKMADKIVEKVQPLMQAL